MMDDQEMTDTPTNATTPPTSGGAPTTQQQSAADTLLSSLTQQLACVTTHDKDYLIKELQRIVGDTSNTAPSAVTDYVAAFFLDMNNWNLQSAICSFYDLMGNTQSTHDLQTVRQQHSSLPSSNTSTQTPITITGSTGSFSSKLITVQSESTHPIPLSFDAPSQVTHITLFQNTPTKFQVVMENSGPSLWPPGSVLKFVQGDGNIVVRKIEDCDKYEQCAQVAVNSNSGLVEPGCCGTSTVTMATESGSSSSMMMHWQLCTPDGYLFGQLVSFRIDVMDGGSQGNNIGELARDLGRMGWDNSGNSGGSGSGDGSSNMMG